jgi:hypothetical protein
VLALVCVPAALLPAVPSLSAAAGPPRAAPTLVATAPA